MRIMISFLLWGVCMLDGFTATMEIFNQSEVSKKELSFELTALFRAYRATITKNKDAIHAPHTFFTKENIDKRVQTMHKQAQILYKMATKKAVNTNYTSDAGKVRKHLEASFEKVLRDFIQGGVDLDWKGKNVYVKKWDGKFLPARWASLAAENFNLLTDGKVTIKLTTSDKLLVNKNNAPDDWENMVINNILLGTTARNPGDPQIKNDPQIYRYVLPEYYKPGCISCHGTGTNQEGSMIHPINIPRKVFDFAGAISVQIHP